MPDGYEDALTSWPLDPSRQPIRPDEPRLPRDPLRCFAAFQAGHGRSDDPAKVTARHVRDYIATRQNETSPGTTGIDYRNLRASCDRLVRADDLSASLMADIGHPIPQAHQRSRVAAACLGSQDRSS